MCNSSYPKKLPSLHAVFPSSCCHIFPALAFSKTPPKRCLLSLYLSPFCLGLAPFGLISFPLHEMSLVNVSPETYMLQTSFLIFLNLLVAFDQVTTPSAVENSSSFLPGYHSPVFHWFHLNLLCSLLPSSPTTKLWYALGFSFWTSSFSVYTHWHGVSWL